MKTKKKETAVTGSRNRRDYRRIVVKIGTSSLVHTNTGRLDYGKMERFARALSDLQNQGREVVLVSSGAIRMGKSILRTEEEGKQTEWLMALAAVGQGRLMMVYEKLFSEYGKTVAQMLLTRESIISTRYSQYTKNTLSLLLEQKVIPIINENDSVSSEEIVAYVGAADNDTLSAYVAKLIDADLLIILSDIDGLYTDDPRKNPDASIISEVDVIGAEIEKMGKGSGTSFGTGGMATKIEAAKIATKSGTDVVIVNGKRIDNIRDAVNGKSVGTLFRGKDKKKRRGHES